MSTHATSERSVQPLAAGDFDGSDTASRALLAGTSEMGRLIRSLDWSKTPLGPSETWSPALQTTVGLMMANRFPLLLWWGPEYISIYNDAYIPVLGLKHPKALGLPVRECWSEIWHILKPLIDAPFSGGSSTWIEDFELHLQRSGFTEEAHFTVAYSPVPDAMAPNGIGGVLATVHEISQKVVAERRVAILRDLGTDAAESTAEETCRVAAETLARHIKDVPFALLYLIEPDGKHARLAGASGIARGETASPLVASLEAAETGRAWPIAEAFRSQALVEVTDLAARFHELRGGPWSDPLQAAVVVPLRSNKAKELFGLLIGGVSPRLKYDEQYRDFYELAASQVAAAIAKARAYEEERRRAEALAEIDRAKTRFFSNVSHEFRTPLTLMLGPLEDMLGEAHSDHLPGTRAQLEVAHRNGLRLLKLVNTMLDFSRIEAGRIQASYQATDLAALTTELASNFYSACEKAGLELLVECPPLAASEPAYVDRDMWEKIVLNLVSNAFKFTLEGRIEVRLAAIDGEARLTVRDTGVGIPADELPRVFERFHRVEQTRGRSYEGSGIGLAFVQELVRLHGGTVQVESGLGKGSTFTVVIPLGSAHLDPERIGKVTGLAPTGIAASAYVEEALRWLPAKDRPGAEQTFVRSLEASSGDIRPVPDNDRRARVVWADDNADLRNYVGRLLGARFDVTAVPDGEAALEAARANPPDLVLSDVMMPRLDGFGLLRALRTDPQLRDVPVILLSARAGEESRIEGVEAGADDYLVKPFSARELIARVETQAKLGRTRRESEDRIRQANAELAKRVAELQDARRAALNIMEDAELARHHVEALNAQLQHEMAEREKAEGASWRLAAIVESSQDAVVSKDLNGVIKTWNRGAERLFGYAAEEVIGKPITIVIPQDRQGEEPEILDCIRRGERVESYETVRKRKDGTLIDISLTVSPVKDRSGNVIGASKIARDISERKRVQARQELLTREIQHRTKNLFAVVRAVVGRSFAGKQTVEEAESAVVSRLASLAQTHVMLMDKEWEGLDLAEVIGAEMSPYAGRVKIEGPKLTLSPKAAQNFSLAVHELSTNAAKYGALSNATGRVHISWSISRQNGAGACSFRWQEHGGPPVTVPVHKGFGSTVLEYVMGEYFSEPPRMEFAPSGLTYALTASLEAITSAEQADIRRGGGNATSSEGSRGPVHPDH
jgi:PAS domain S-box-containing protein